MIKTGTYYKFNSKEDYIDFLKTAEKEGFIWNCGQKPTDKECINYYNKSCYFYIHVDENHCLLCGNNSLIHFTATWWTKETPKGITASIIACDDGTSYDKVIASRIIESFDRLKKEGDFEEMKIIINEPAVILIKNGKKYVSKVHDEEFDAEKGLLMCLAKANGVTHLDLKRMLKKATHQSKKYVEVARKPKVGDYVKIVNHFPGEYRVKVGEIYKVERLMTDEHVVVSNDKYKNILLNKWEYTVLEGKA